MAKLFVVASTLVVLLVGVAMAANGETKANPSKMFQNMYRKFVTTYNVVSACRPACAGWCKMMDDSCNDMEGVRNCADSNAECGTTCETLCGCMDQCSADCDATESCDNLGEIETETCMMRKASCNDECVPQCPIDFFPQYYGGSWKEMEDQMGVMFVKVFQGMVDLEDMP